MTEFGSNTRLLNESKTKYHACSIEKVPEVHWDGLNSKHKGDSDQCGFWYVCGLYELNEENAEEVERKGQVLLYDNIGEVRETVDMPSGILDMKWSGDGQKLACALSDCELQVMHVQQQQEEEEGTGAVVDSGSGGGSSCPFISTLASARDEDKGLLLTVEWDDRVTPSVSPRIAVSTQTGALQVYTLTETGLDVEMEILGAHKLFGECIPAWSVAFNPHTKQQLISGGDDMLMKLWDIRSTPTMPSAISKRHEAGVTVLQWHPENTHVFASGSYDEYVRLWDERKLSTPVSELHVGGGVWRLKWQKTLSEQYVLVAACMHAGSHVLGVDFESIGSTDGSSSSSGGEREVASLRKLLSHRDSNPDHLNYGIDTLSSSLSSNKTHSESASGGGGGGEGEGEVHNMTFASCSFYDNLVQVWTGEYPY